MRIEPNPTMLADYEKTRTALKKAWKARGIPVRVIAAECGVHGNTLLKFIHGMVTAPRREQFDQMKSWAEKNKNAKPPPRAKLQKELAERIKAAYLARKAEGKNLDDMVGDAGVNRTVLSQLMNGTYTRALRPSTMKALNAWVTKALK